MREYKQIEIKVDKVDKVFCNMCGERIKTDKCGNLEDYIHIEKKWGYNSDMDGEKHSIDLCQNCYKDIFNKLKIKIN